jgi:hypothetical protein
MFTRILTAAALVLSLGVSMAPAFARELPAQPATCYLEDHGKVLLNGLCDLRWLDTGKGSFHMVDDEVDARFHVVVNRDTTGVASGAYWSTEKSETKNDGVFGVMRQKGACWQNRTQRICAGQVNQNVMPAFTLNGAANIGD